MERKLNAVDLVADLAGGLTWAAAFAAPGVGHVLAVTAGVLGLAKVARGGFRAFQADRSTTLDAIRKAAYAKAETMVATLGEKFDLKDADAALATSLEHCVLDTAQLLAAAQTKEGYAARGTELVIAALAQRRPDLFGAARQNDNALAYARAVVLAALESAMSGDNFTALQPKFELETQRKLALLVELNGDEVAWRARIEGKIDSGFADLKNDTSRILALLEATGLSKTQVRNLLDAFEHGAMPIEKAEELLLKAAAELRGLRERLSRLSNEDSAEIQTKLAAARKAIDDGDFKHADELLAEAESIDLKAGQESFQAGEQRIRRAANTMAERASLAQAQAQFEVAAEHFGRAAKAISHYDQGAAWRWRFDQAVVLGAHGDLFPGMKSLHQAVAIWRTECLPSVSQNESPMDWSMAQSNLGIALRILGERSGGEDAVVALVDAIAAHRRALTIHTRKDHPALWAMSQRNLGNALRTLGERVGGERGMSALIEAANALRLALEVRTEKNMPEEWAMTQNDLGAALRVLGSRAGGKEGLDMLNESVVRYRSALVIQTREKSPQNWAMAQNNLGVALAMIELRLNDDEGRIALAGAITAFRLVLEVWTKSARPVAWASTQDNLGNALRRVGEREGGEMSLSALGEAAVAHQSALTVFTRAEMPADWALTNENIALTEYAIARITRDSVLLEQALWRLDEVITIFTTMNAAFNIEKAEHNQAEIDRYLKELRGID